jgi:hypothetical protein
MLVSMTRIAKPPPAKPAKRARRLRRPQPGQLLIDPMQASPHRDIDIDIEPSRTLMPVRDQFGDVALGLSPPADAVASPGRSR